MRVTSERVGGRFLWPWRTAALAALAVATAAPASGQDMPMNMPAGDHTDMFYSVPKPLTIRLIDDRYRDVPVQVAPKPISNGTVLILEGDIAVGRQDDVLKAILNEMSRIARSIANPDDPALKLTDLQRGLIGLLKTLPTQATRLDFTRTADHDRATQLLDLGAQLVTQFEQLSVLFNDPKYQPLFDSIRKALQDVKRPLSAPPDVQSYAAIRVGSQYRWPKGVIPYYIDDVEDVVPSQTRNFIEAAVDHWNRATPKIYLRKSKRDDPYWLRFRVMRDPSKRGCWSFVGKSVTSGEQTVGLDVGCEFDQVVHEIGHAVGLFHEQSRTDRDKYIDVVRQNMLPGTEAQFDLIRRGEGQDFGPFDFASVMLYGPSAFARAYNQNDPSTFTMLPKPALMQKGLRYNWGVNHRIAAGLKGLSKGDVKAVAFMYPDDADRSDGLVLKSLPENAAPPAAGDDQQAQPGAAAAPGATVPAAAPGAAVPPPPTPAAGAAPK